jgi:hypothetical protein
MIKEYSDIINCPFCKHQQSIYLDLDLKIQSSVCKNPKCQKTFNIPIKSKRVYLSRSFDCADTKYKFPIFVRKMYDGILESVDPLEFIKKIDPKPDDEIIPELNKRWIDSCNIYVGLIENASFGTLGELSYAKSKPIPTYIINPNRVWTNDIWLKYQATKIFEDIDECFRFIINDIIYDYNIMIQGEKQ